MNSSAPEGSHRAWLWPWAVTASVFLALSLPKAGQPISDDEIYEVRNAERILAGEAIQLYVPPV